MTYWDNGPVQLYQADARSIPLADQSVHCVVTSPPYYGLRVYKDNDDRGIGLESSMEAYIANMVEVFREVWRVLRDDGVAWVNLGDSYAGSAGNNRGTMEWTTGGNPSPADGSVAEGLTQATGLSQGNRLGIPERVVLALQADGWVWRDTIIWAKKSAMPESLAGWRWERCQKRTWVDPVTNEELRRDRQNGRDFGTPQVERCPGCPKCQDNDGLVLRKGSWRCTSAHEYIYMMTKGMGYYADGEAVKTASDANRRSVWNDISPEPYGGSHFATFPSDLPRLCIQASTSEQGCCPKCGSQWARVIKQQEPPSNYTPHFEPDNMVRGFSSATPGFTSEIQTLGWRPSCGHTEAIERPAPALVLDPFAGTGTTCAAAQRLGRRAVGVDISEAYLEQAVRRLSAVTLPMINF